MGLDECIRLNENCCGHLCWSRNLRDRVSASVLETAVPTVLLSGSRTRCPTHVHGLKISTTYICNEAAQGELYAIDRATHGSSFESEARVAIWSKDLAVANGIIEDVLVAQVTSVLHDKFGPRHGVNYQVGIMEPATQNNLQVNFQSPGCTGGDCSSEWIDNNHLFHGLD